MRASRVLSRAAAAALVAPAALSVPSAPLAAQAPAAATATAPTPGAPAPSGPAAERLGLTAAVSGGVRDTLGLLVVAVARDGPADRAGVTEGSRLAEVNGVSLRLSPNDLTDRDGGAGVVRRLDHALWDVRPGDGVVLRLAGFGAGRTVTVTTAGAPAAPTPAPAPAVPVVATAAPVVASGALSAATTAAVPNVTPAGDLLPAPGARPTLPAVVEAMGDLQTQLHQLARDEPALADTLASVADDLAALRRRVRLARGPAAAAAPAAAPNVPAAERAVLRVREDAGEGAGAASAALPGLRVAPVGDDLARYFGPGSERGLLVVQADSTWDPIRAGDVLVRVDGAPADVARLRAAFSGRQRSTVEFLRRGRVLAVTLPEGGGR